jgi:hypothetical protein
MNNKAGWRFEAALAEVERALARSEPAAAFERRPAAPLLLDTKANGPEANGRKAIGSKPGEARDVVSERWGQAFDWSDEPPEDPPAREQETKEAPRAEPPHSDQPEAIAAEIGLGPDLALDEINRRWRSFVWRNHPDRRPHVDRDLMTRRVAVANSLVAAARQAILARRAGP